MIIELAIIISAAIFGGHFAARILPELQNTTNLSPQWASVVSYVISFLFIAIVLSLIGKFIQRLFDFANLSFVNRIVGAIISIGIGMVILSIILNITLVLDRNNNIIKEKTAKESFFYDRVKSVVPAIIPYLKFEDINSIIPDEYIDKIDEIKKEIIDSEYQEKYFKVDSI